ncbi:uncharacterized protein LOC135350084 [Halichondria panicea]|uniref:uncharacterized protein LOC135350084 n=1 Tax=Halichondria panicea TaxID=6063 RepID=UPI00312B6DDF
MSSMAETEQVPLLENVNEMALFPPPSYQPMASLPEETKTKAEVYEADKVIPLPSYDQSQKYEQDGVLEMEEDEEPEPTQSLSVMSKPPGTCLDFTMFFLLCCFFGLVGFIFSICFAFTIAAESGALTGLGLALIFKLFAFETYDTVNFYNGSCEMYYGTTDHTKEQCMKRLFYLTRLLFWFMGIFGLYLFIKGFHRYAASRKLRMQLVIQSPSGSVDSS